MKIAYIGNFEPEYSTENDVRKAFEFLGHEVLKIQENAPAHQKSFPNDVDLVLITGTWDGLYSPEEVIDSFKRFAEMGIPTATLHLDTFWGKSRGGRKWWLHPMFHTAYIFTADGDYQKEWRLFGKNHYWLPPAVRHDAVHKGKFREEYACDLAFVGSNGQGYHEDVWNYRKELVDFLRGFAKQNNLVWKNPGGDHPKISRGEDMNDFYASAKVTVGDSLCLKRQESHYWSDRIPEALGRGGFLIMPRINTIDQDPEYYGHVPMYDWGDFDGLGKIIEENLIDEIYRKHIINFNLGIIQEKHTYVNRAQEMLKVIFADLYD